MNEVNFGRILELTSLVQFVALHGTILVRYIGLNKSFHSNQQEAL